jgi:hypothetical protein
MNKLIQTILLTAVVSTPLSLISLVTSAAAHHTSSHVSTVSVAITKTRKKRIKKAKKSITTGTRKQKPTKIDATSQPPEGIPSGANPVNPNKPAPTGTSRSTIKTEQTVIDGSSPNADKMIKVPATGTNMPGVPMPEITKPTLPNLPTKLPN